MSAQHSSLYMYSKEKEEKQEEELLQIHSEFKKARTAMLATVT